MQGQARVNLNFEENFEWYSCNLDVSLWQKNSNTTKFDFLLAFKQSAWPFSGLFNTVCFLLKFSSGNPAFNPACFYAVILTRCGILHFRQTKRDDVRIYSKHSHWSSLIEAFAVCLPLRRDCRTQVKAAVPRSYTCILHPGAYIAPVFWEIWSECQTCRNIRSSVRDQLRWRFSNCVPLSCWLQTNMIFRNFCNSDGSMRRYSISGQTN